MTDVECPYCSADVPPGVFCGNCGAHLNPQPGDGPRWLRPRAYCLASAEYVLRPAITSSLFPHMSQISRAPFALGLVLILLAMAVAVELRLPGALIAFATLGLPLLFLIYRQQTGVFHDVPRSTLLLTVALGIGLGVGWVLLTGDLLIRETATPFEAGIAGTRTLRKGLGMAQGGVLAMMVPAVVVRLVRPGVRESLQGFLIGGMGALFFTAAATFTRLAPQFAAGPVAADQTVGGLLVEAGIRGLTVPITAVCAGGLLGAALWFSRPARGPRLPRPTVHAALIAAFAVVMVNYGFVGAIDAAGLPQFQILTWHVVMTLVAVITLRIGLQIAVLHEAPDPPTRRPEICLHCRNVVPDMPFCPACGAAGHGTSRACREIQQRVTPLHGTWDEDHAPAEMWPGYAVDAARYTSAPLARTPMARVLGLWLASIVTVAASLVGLSAAIATPMVQYNCPPDCGNPPIGTPLALNPRFTAPDESFSVSYPAPDSAYEVTQGSDGITARFTAGDGGVLRLWSQPAAGRSAEDIVAAILATSYPNALKAYEIPNAMVGYQGGYGEVADIWPQDADASYRRLRVVLLAAVKNDLALIAGAVGPYRAFSPTFGPGKPSGTNLQLALDMGQYVNSFAWRGDPPR